MTTKKYVRKTLLITKEQDRKLRATAYKYGISESEIVRLALKNHLGK
jgi:hypothetical protein